MGAECWQSHPRPRLEGLLLSPRETPPFTFPEDHSLSLATCLTRGEYGNWTSGRQALARVPVEA